MPEHQLPFLQALQHELIHVRIGDEPSDDLIESRCSTRSCLSRSTFLKVSVSIFSVTSALDRCEPVPLLVAKGQEVRVQQVVFGVVPQRPTG